MWIISFVSELFLHVGGGILQPLTLNFDTKTWLFHILNIVCVQIRMRAANRCPQRDIPVMFSKGFTKTLKKILEYNQLFKFVN